MSEVEILPIRHFLAALEYATSDIEQFNKGSIQGMVAELVAVRERGGRLFLIGVGGSAANCSHAAADFRTLCGIEAYAFENVANITALTNDQGWGWAYAFWLKAGQLKSTDLLYVMSVGGGTKQYSANLIAAMNYAQGLQTPIIGVAGRDGGALSVMATACVVVPEPTDKALITPITESMQAVIWHLLVSHPALKRAKTAWEGK